MNCRQVRDALPLFVGGDLEGDERSRVEAHLVDCAACRAERERADSVFAPLRRLGPTDAPVPGADALWAGISVQMGWAASKDATPRIAPRRAWIRSLRTIGGIAAVFLLGLGLGLGSTLLGARRPVLPQPDWSAPHRDAVVAQPVDAFAPGLPGWSDFAADEVQPVDTGSGSRRFLLWNVQPQDGGSVEIRVHRSPQGNRFHLEQIRSVDNEDLVAGY